MAQRDGVDDKETEFERIALVHLDTIYNSALRMTRNGAKISICVFEGLPIEFVTFERVEFKNTQIYTTEYADKRFVLWKEGDRVCSFIGQVAQEELLAMAVETRSL